MKHLSLRTTLTLHTLTTLVVIGLVAPSVFATGSETPACDLKRATEQLATLKAEGTNILPVTELTIRTDLLTNTMACGIADVDELQKKLDGITDTSADITSLKQAYSDQLAAARSYYSEQVKLVATAQSIDRTKDIARGVKAWRDDTYSPMAWEVVQLSSLAQSRSLLNAANDRMGQLDLLATPVLLLKDQKAISDALAAAHTSLGAAWTAHNGAVAALNQDPRTSQEAITANAKTSLESLGLTYESFLVASTAIKQILPTGK